MNYSKPEVAILGDAAIVIQGPKTSPPDGPAPVNGPDTFELED